MYTWPFPSKDNPLKPWTPEQVKEYNKQQRQQVVHRLRKMPDAPMVLGLI